MKELVTLLPVVLYVSVGMICLVMAFKCLFSAKILPFHEKAAGKQWDEFEPPVKLVLLSFLRLSGLGFLIMAVLLMFCPIVNYCIPNMFYKYLIPFLALLFCVGLVINNYVLYRRTGADTPWKGSLYAMVVIVAGIVISLFA
jgi:hypothetical protein